MWPFDSFAGFGPWASYQGQPGQAYMLGQQANNMAQGFPANTAIPPPSNPFQNLQQTQAAAQAANASLAAGGTGATGGTGNFIDNISKMFGGGQQANPLSQLMSQAGPQAAPGGGKLLGTVPPPTPQPMGQAPISQGLLAALNRPVVGGGMGFMPNNVLPGNAANNFNGMGMQAYLARQRLMSGG